MDLMTRFKEQAKKEPKRIVFPEGEDERILTAASMVLKERIARPILLGRRAEIERIASEKQVDIKDIPLVETRESEELEKYAASYCERKGDISISIARRLVKKGLFFGAMMVSCGDAEGMVGGIIHATASVLQVSGLAIGYKEGISTPSSFFIMVVPEALGEKDKLIVFADCAVNVNPTVEQLADIAVSTGRNARELLGLEPRIALLSFSTKGSASHELIDKVVRAASRAGEKAPDLEIEGELQADAALVERIAAKKVKGGSVAGRANVLIFPDLNAGNIAYKLVQYLAKAKAYGPVLQGFKKPVNDLSRGASVEDVVGVTVITVVQAQ
ncbi:phosphate acetyltransferase [candidate division NPL-UPA2 bacterium]|nr:phosphate acetyltransferase [candidate division NPL-UPA2 bacterium]